MDKISIVLDGVPVAQGRPRFTTRGGYGRAYDPAPSREFKERVRLAAAVAMRGREPLTGPLWIAFRAYRPIPKSMSKKRAALAEAGQIVPITKPDYTNYIKGVEDALKGVVYHDDAQIIGPAPAPHSGKFYSVRPRIEVELMAWESPS